MLVGVQGGEPITTSLLADAVAMRIESSGRVVIRAAATDFMSRLGVDYSFLWAALLMPFRAGESFALVGSRADGDVLFDPRWTSAPADAVLVVDGPHLDHPELPAVWNYLLPVHDVDDGSSSVRAAAQQAATPATPR